MQILVIADVPVAATHGTAARAIREDARSRLKHVTVDVLDRLALTSFGDTDQDFLSEVLGVIPQLRRATLEESVQCAAVAHRQCLKERLIAPGNARDAGPALLPIACHSSLPSRESEPVRRRNQPCDAGGMR